MHDIALALMATQTQTTEVLDTFPTIPAVQEAEQILAEAENPEVTIRRKPDPAGIHLRHLQRAAEERLADE